jgi:hypothetical protein
MINVSSCSANFKRECSNCTHKGGKPSSKKFDNNNKQSQRQQCSSPKVVFPLCERLVQVPDLYKEFPIDPRIRMSIKVLLDCE